MAWSFLDKVLIAFMMFIFFIGGIGIMGFTIWLDHQKRFGKYPTAFVSPRGHVNQFRYIKPVSKKLNEWKMPDPDHPGKIKFNLKPVGMGRAEPVTWDKDDFIELGFVHGKRKLILFGINGLNERFSREKSDLHKMIDILVRDKSIVEGDYHELKTRFDEKKKEDIAVARSTVVFQPNKSQGSGGIKR